MNFLSKLFGKSNSEWNGQPTAKMLDEDKFWNIVDKTGTDEIDEQEGKLVNALLRLTPEEMIGFRLRTDKLLHDTYTSEMWCAAYILNDGCSDDMFEYFRLWVISKGKAVYYAAKADPDSLVSQLGNSEEFDFESFWSVANTAFQEKTGKDLYDYIDYSHFEYGEGKYPQFEFTWKEEDPSSMKAICPQLYNLKWAE